MGEIVALDSGQNPNQWLREIADRYGDDLVGVFVCLVVKTDDEGLDAVPLWVGDGLKGATSVFAVRSLSRAVEALVYDGVEPNETD